MQRLMKICARGALGLGAAALLLSGVPAHANPAGSPPPGESQPRFWAQSKAQPGEAEKLEAQRLKEQQERARMQQEQNRKLEMQQPKRMRAPAARREAPDAAREAMPAPPGNKPFGAGVIRKNEKPVDEE